MANFDALHVRPRSHEDGGRIVKRETPSTDELVEAPAPLSEHVQEAQKTDFVAVQQLTHESNHHIEMDQEPPPHLAKFLQTEKERILGKYNETASLTKNDLIEVLEQAVEELENKTIGTVATFNVKDKTYFAFLAPSRKTNNVQMKIYEIKEMVGKGSFGEVNKVQKVYQSKVYARKLLSGGSDAPPVAMITKILGDLWKGGLPKLNGHTPIMQPPMRTAIFEQIITNNSIEKHEKTKGVGFLLTEFYEKNVKDMIKSPYFTEEYGEAFVGDMLFALEIFEARKLLHPDFKPGNVMMTAGRFIVIDCDDLMKKPNVLPTGIRKRILRNEENPADRLKYQGKNLDRLKMNFQEKGTAEYYDQRNLEKIDESVSLSELHDAATARGRISWGVGLFESLTGSRPLSNHPTGKFAPLIVFPLANEKFSQLPVAVQNTLTLLAKGDINLKLDQIRKLISENFKPPDPGVSVLVQRLNNIEELTNGNIESSQSLVSEIVVLALAAKDKEALELALSLAASYLKEDDEEKFDLLNTAKLLLESTAIPSNFDTIIHKHFERNAFGTDAVNFYSHAKLGDISTPSALKDVIHKVFSGKLTQKEAGQAIRISMSHENDIENFSLLPITVQNTLTLSTKGNVNLMLAKTRELIKDSNEGPDSNVNLLIQRLKNVEEVTQGNIAAAQRLVGEIAILALAKGDKDALEPALQLAAGYLTDDNKEKSALLKSIQLLADDFMVPVGFDKIMRKHLRKKAFGPKSRSIYKNMKLMAAEKLSINLKSIISTQNKRLQDYLTARTENSSLLFATNKDEAFVYLGETAVIALLTNETKNFINTLEYASSCLPENDPRCDEIKALLTEYRNLSPEENTQPVLQKLGEIFSKRSSL